jgi:hypothetical protein
MRSSGPRGESIVFPDVLSARGRLTRRWMFANASASLLVSRLRCRWACSRTHTLCRTIPAAAGRSGKASVGAYVFSQIAVANRKAPAACVELAPHPSETFRRKRQEHMHSLRKLATSNYAFKRTAETVHGVF